MKVWLLLLASLVHVKCLSAQSQDVKTLDIDFEYEERAARGVIRKPRSIESQKTSEDPLLKVLSFADDNDNKVDKEGEFTSATLKRANLPGSFTICLAFMVDAWTTHFSAVRVFDMLRDDRLSQWGKLSLYAAESYTEYQVKLGHVEFLVQISSVFFPLQWTKMCLSVDSTAGKLKLVVDGQLLGEAEYDKKGDPNRPTNLNLLLGLNPNLFWEYTGKTTNLNIFHSALSVERMQRMTKAGGEDCGAPGNFLSWEEAEWSLHSKAKIVEVNEQAEGPCRRESKLHVFMADFHQECMHHCRKIVEGRTPPVSSMDEWENFTKEIDLITPDRSKLAWMWLPGTEGGIDNQLSKLPHWPEEETVNNVTFKLDAEETVWRDYYTGLRLENWTKPYRSSNKDGSRGETYNCLMTETNHLWNESWTEQQCQSFDTSCPCQYPAQPVLRLRGLCKDSSIDTLFTPKQLYEDPDNMILLGITSTRIMFDKTGSHWKLTSAKYDVTAVSWSPMQSYLLGKHNWTVSNDVYKCRRGKPYDALFKLTGCKEDEFTCDDGQCTIMEKRCNQVPDCRDKTDEKDCQLVILEEGYNNNIPPIKRSTLGSPIPASVSISIILMKVVDIDEVDHSIQLQFHISLQWSENRAKYLNLKEETSLNALTNDDIQKLWLPLVIYYNTDQKESTRLGWVNEWTTRVTVTREGNFTRAGLNEVDEAEIFEGAENNLTMTQTYTHEFQCSYGLQRYPFDTQVKTILNFHQIMHP